MDLSEEDVQKILRILDELDYGEIRLEVGALKLHLQKTRTGDMPAMASPSAPAPAAPSEGSSRDGVHEIPTRPSAAESARLHVVKAPIAGVFYHAPAPGKPPFTSAGQHVHPEDTVGILEVMKLFQSVAAGVGGRVTEVLVGNGEAVQRGQALVAIEIAT